MDEECILNELVKAKDCIRRKYNALKAGETNVQQLVSKTFKPIIDPLNKISNTSFLAPPKPPQNIDKNNIEETEPIEILLDEENASEDKYQQRIINWFQSYDLDKTYGPKLDYSNGVITLGNGKINFFQNTLIIKDTIYPLTPELVRLLFYKHPTVYNENDLERYKQILIQTSAHLTQNGKKNRKGGDKYTEIIEKLFPTSGSGLSVKLQKHNSVYWDDPNELVDRLRLLLSSHAAGNTGVSNEILSIFEELLEAGLIKRIPNV